MFSKQNFGHTYGSCTIQHTETSSLWLQCPCSSRMENNEAATSFSIPGTFDFAAFTQLLPDSGVELYRQHADDAYTQFPLFGDLPEELRIMIWRAAFPRNRTVQVELSPSFAILHSHTPSPVTLHINRESRAETLKFYVPLLDPCPRRPILFHPGLDTVYFHRRENNPLFFMQSYAYLTSRSLAGIAKIQFLKVSKMYYGGPLQGWIKFGTPRRSLYGHGNFVEPDRGGLRFFHGLEELVLVADSKIEDDTDHLGVYSHPDGMFGPGPEDIILSLDSKDKIDDYVQVFKGFFEWEREKSPKCKIPDVVVRQGKNPRQDKWYLGRLSEILR